MNPSNILGNNVNISSYGVAVTLNSNVRANVTLNITGATISATSYQAIQLNAASYTTTVSISSGMITGGNASNAYPAIYATGDGTKNITITGGTLRGYGDYGVYLNKTSITLNIGSKDTNTPLTSPVIVGATYGVGGVANSTINWYDGYLYGTTPTGNYSMYPSDLPNNYAPVTTADIECQNSC